MKLATLRANIGSEIKLSKSANRFIKSCRFYINTANTMDVQIKVVGPQYTSYAKVNSRSIVSFIVPVVKKKVPSIKTMKGNSFSNEFKLLCSLMHGVAIVGSGYSQNNKKVIDNLTEAGLLEERNKYICVSVTGKALIKKRLTSIIKSGKTFEFKGRIIKVSKLHSTAIKLESTNGELSKSNIDFFTNSAVRTVVKIKNGDIVRIKTCSDRKSIIGKTAKVIHYRRDTTRQDTRLLVDGFTWWLNHTDIEFVKTPAIKKPKVVKPKVVKPKFGDYVLLDITTPNLYVWVDQLKSNSGLPWEITGIDSDGCIQVKRERETWNIRSENIKKVLTKKESIIAAKKEQEMIAEKKKEAARLKRLDSYKAQLIITKGLRIKLAESKQKQHKLYNEL